MRATGGGRSVAPFAAVAGELENVGADLGFHGPGELPDDACRDRRGRWAVDGRGEVALFGVGWVDGTGTDGEHRCAFPTDAGAPVMHET
ncbi:hypothetical protein GCM10022224_080880 [Nonomuraea antimicrobica]|uniref:Uncharacterized protein n=1 Tax=Nonomuraea antimicrobica TaxID=561173 RepID=A0ABP7DE11_9ACTN